MERGGGGGGRGGEAYMWSTDQVGVGFYPDMGVNPLGYGITIQASFVGIVHRFFGLGSQGSLPVRLCLNYFIHINS